MEENNYQIILQFLEGKLSADQRKELAQWRKTNPQNEQQFKETQFLWEKTALAKTAKPSIKIDTQAALAKVQQQLPKTTKVIPFRRKLLHFAAAASVLFLLGFMTWLTFLQPPEMIQLATLSNETKQVILPDNSTVWLNENSNLSYPKNFDNKIRQVVMNGDVIFEVTPNKTKPFIVISENLAVQVLGTKFNIQSTTSDNKSATVHVLHGKVQVQQRGSLAEKVILEKGMTTLFDQKNNTLTLIEDFAINQLFWQTNTLSFKATPLKEVVADLNTAYNKEVILTNPQVLACPFTGIFNKKSLDEILSSLQLIYGFEIKAINSQTFQLNQGLCN